jgi:hypothetical protein
MNPYIDERINENEFIRRFSDADEKEFVWHRDIRSRTITVKDSSNDWFIQYDNNLPVKLLNGEKWFIQKYRYHRLIKGTGPLVLHIEEH